MWDMVTKQTEWLVDGKKIYFTEGEKDSNLVYLIHNDEQPLFMSFESGPAVTFFMKYSKGKVIQELKSSNHDD